MTLKDRWRARAASAFLVGPLVAGLLSVASPAQAQFVAPQGTTIDTQLFQPAIGPRNFLTVENTSIPEHKLLGFQLALTYQRHPYTIYTQGFTTGATNVVDYQWWSELSASMGLFGRAGRRSRRSFASSTRRRASRSRTRRCARCATT